MGVDDRSGDNDDFLPCDAAMAPEHLEGWSLTELVSLHQNSLGPLRARALCEGALQAVVAGEAAEGDVERTLKLLCRRVDDVCEDSALGRPIDERGVACFEHRDDGAFALVHNALDQTQGVFGAWSEADESDVGVCDGCEFADFGDFVRSRDDDVAELREEFGDVRNTIHPLIGD